MYNGKSYAFPIEVVAICFTYMILYVRERGVFGTRKSVKSVLAVR